MPLGGGLRCSNVLPMHGTTVALTPRPRRGRLLVVGCALAFGVGACGDDKGKTTPAAQAPESRVAPDTEVETGLKKLVVVARDISREQDPAAAKRASEGLEPVWEKVEGTVKKNEPDLYVTIEDDLSLLESGEAAKTRIGADEMAKTVSAYLAKHPG